MRIHKNIAIKTEKMLMTYSGLISITCDNSIITDPIGMGPSPYFHYINFFLNSNQITQYLKWANSITCDRSTTSNLIKVSPSL